MTSLALLLGVAAIVALIIADKRRPRPYDHERDGL